MAEEKSLNAMDDDTAAGLGLTETWYTFKELMDQYTSVKAEGLLATKELQVAALEAQTESEPQTLPAQSPQKVVSNTRLWFLKVSFISQSASNSASGEPQADGLGWPAEMSEGTPLRGKNQIETPSEVHSVA